MCRTRTSGGLLGNLGVGLIYSQAGSTVASDRIGIIFSSLPVGSYEVTLYGYDFNNAPPPFNAQATIGVILAPNKAAADAATPSFVSAWGTGVFQTLAFSVSSADVLAGNQVFAFVRLNSEAAGSTRTILNGFDLRRTDQFVCSMGNWVVLREFDGQE